MPRSDFLQAFFDGIRHKPETVFGSVKADVLADNESLFVAAILQRHS
jgi:hypothetical protein